MSPARFIILFCFLPGMLVFSGMVRARVVNPEGPPGGGCFLSAAIVDGAPAVAWMEAGTPAVKYVRADGADGAAWGNPVTLFTGSWFYHVSLCVVGGKPAVCFGDQTSGQLKFIRALDTAGGAWGEPVSVVRVSEPAGYPYDPVGSLVMVNGKPAICYANDKRELMYVRASDAEGTAWEAPVMVDGEGAVYRSCMAMVDGKPAIAYGGVRGVRYVRATGANGGAWGASLELMALTLDVVRLTPSLAVVNGRPAVAFVIPMWGVGYVQATDATGTFWNALNIPESVGYAADQCSLAVVNGKPAIGFAAGVPQNLRYLEATDPDGTVNSWNRWVGVDGGGAGQEMCLLEVQSRPALVHADSLNGRVKYVIRDPSGATPQWPPELTVEHRPTASLLRQGEAVDFGTVAALDPLPVEFRLTNPGTGSRDLVVSGWTLDGPDASEFTVTPLPAGLTLSGFATHTMTVTWTPRSEGPKSATLHLHSNAESYPGFEFRLTGLAANIPGAVNRAFRPSTGTVNAAVLLPDGKIQTSGADGLSRFLPDGSHDLSFFSPAFNGSPPVLCMAVQKDGKVIVGGNFTKVNSLDIAGLARLNADGSLDTSFRPGFAPAVRCLTIGPDGSILAGGSFAVGGLEPKFFLSRVHADGSYDPSFMAFPDNRINTLALQPDGKIFAGGAFREISGSSVRWLQRLSPGGTPDDFTTSFGGEVTELALYPDGRLLTVSDSGRLLRRLTSGGEIDSSINSFLDARVTDLCLQTDGRMLVCGDFSSGTAGLPQNKIARLDDDGSLDPAFDPDVRHLQGIIVQQLLIQPDGKVIIAGDFERVGGLVQLNLARVHNDPAISRLLTPVPSTIRWLRGGSAPEVRDVTFDLKTDNAPDWTRLGSAHRIPGGWELSGLTLPSGGQIRAQAYAGGSVIEQTASILTPLDSWRLQYFNTSANTGDAADDADPDHDSLTNFTEFAFGLSPVERGSNALPEFKHDGTSFTATFTSPEGRENILYGAEWSPSMLPGTWTPVARTGTAGMHHFTIPASTNRVFVRWVVRIQ